MTEKLFYQDSSIKEFTATVESCMQGKDGMFEVILDQTAFFPEGGGQYADTGVLLVGEKEVKVVDVQEKNEIVTHYVTDAIEQGSKVTGRLNYEERFSKMQQHTGEHIDGEVDRGQHGELPDRKGSAVHGGSDFPVVISLIYPAAARVSRNPKKNVRFSAFAS